MLYHQSVSAWVQIAIQNVFQRDIAGYIDVYLHVSTLCMKEFSNHLIEQLGQGSRRWGQGHEL